MKGFMVMTFRTLKILTIIVPTILIGGFEFIRHTILYRYISMETGNFIITILTLVISSLYANWMFKTIELKNKRISAERELRVIYEERERMAKELHDSIAQSLFLLKVDLKKNKMQEAGSVVNSIDTNLRQVIFNLRLKPEEDGGFIGRINNWIEQWSAVTGVESRIDIQLEDGFFSSTDEVQLFGIIQEAFTNIRKHANASNACISLKSDGQNWELTIEDDGDGFSINQVYSHQYGLEMLEERVNKLNAFLDIISEESLGTKIVVKGAKRR
jgi:two-component system nitrate/nitrite sensor histidine kinase NarX